MKSKNYDNLINSIPEGICFVDTKIDLIYLNDNTKNITGLKNKREINRVLKKNDVIKNCLVGLKEDESIISINNRRLVMKVLPVFEKKKITGLTIILSNDKDRLKILQENIRYKELAYNDSLTSLPNRFFIDSIVKNSERYHNSKTAVIFIDVDDFKYINDAYGHDYGDKVLKVVGTTIKDSIKKIDKAGRYGGEEFVIFLFQITKKEAFNTSERIRKNIEKLKLKKGRKDIQITISLGTTIIKENEKFDKAIKRADKLMYQSKQNGKNKTTMD